MTEDECMNEIVAGYKDARKEPDFKPSSNRSHSYRHGFRVGTYDHNHISPYSVADMEEKARVAIEKDMQA